MKNLNILLAFSFNVLLLLGAAVKMKAADIDIQYLTLSDNSSAVKVFIMPLIDTDIPKNTKGWSTPIPVMGTDGFYKSLNDSEIAFSIKNTSTSKKLIKIRCGATTHLRQVATLVTLNPSDTIWGKFVFPKYKGNTYDFDYVVMKDGN